MTGFKFLFIAMLLLFCVSSFLLVRKTALSACYLVGFRALFSVAAFLKFDVVPGVPYFTLAFATSWIVLIINFVTDKVRLSIHAPILLFYLLTGLIVANALGFYLAAPASAPLAVDAVMRQILPLVVYMGAYAGLKSPADLQKLERPIMALCLGPVAIGLWQSATGYSYSYELDAFVPGIRPVGSIIDANAYGIFLCLAVFLLAPFALQRRHRLAKILLVLTFAAILFSKNRGSWIAMILAVLLGIAIFHRHLNLGKWLLAGVVVSLAAAPLVIARFGDLDQYDQYGNSKDTFSERLDQGARLLERAYSSPLYGYGPGSSVIPWGTSNIARPPHDDYVRLIYEYGFPAAILYVVFLLAQASLCFRLRKYGYWRFGFAAFMSTVYLMVISFSQNLLFDQISYSMVFLQLAVSHRALDFGRATVRQAMAPAVPPPPAPSAAAAA